METYKGTDRRSTERHEELVKAVIVAVRAEVASQVIPEKIHLRDHAFVDEWIAEQQRKREWREKVKAQVGGWVIISMLGALGKVGWELWLLAKEHWK